MTPAEAGALDLIVERNVAALIAAVSSATPPEEIFALALVYSDGQRELEPAAVHLCPRSVRDNVLATIKPEDVSDHLWDFNAWPGDGVDVQLWPSDGADLVAASERLVSALEAAGVEPVRWTLVRVSRAMQNMRMPFATTPDFVVVALDPAHVDVLADNVRASAPFEAVEALSRQFALLSDGPEIVFEQRVANVEEVVDMESGEYTAVFDCTLDEELDGPQDLSLDAALDWAKERADRVRLSVGEIAYSAGSVQLEDLAPWTSGDRPVRRLI